MSATLPVKTDQGTGRPLILLHGLGNNHKSWDFVLPHLDETQWRVITLDLLGFGDAPKISTDYTPEVHADAVIETLTSLGVERATFAGHSMGCIVALNIAARYPERTEQLALFGAPLYKKKPVSNRRHKLLRTEGLYFSLFEIVKKNPEAVQAGGSIADELIPFVRGLELTEETWPAYKSSLEHTIMQFTSYQQAAHLKIPTLFVNGLLDFFIIRKNVRLVQKSNPKNIRIRRTLGPHELTPRQGKTIGRILSTLQ